jgi:acyl carrier protein
MDAIENKILGALKAKFGGQPRSSDYLVDLGVDSLGMAELGAELESQFRIKIDEEVLGVETVQELAEYIRSKSQAVRSLESTDQSPST